MRNSEYFNHEPTRTEDEYFKERVRVVSGLNSSSVFSVSQCLCERNIEECIGSSL